MFISASDICAAIDAADEMHVLRMNGNTLGVEAAKHIGESLMKHPEFQVLYDINIIFYTSSRLARTPLEIW